MIILKNRLLAVEIAEQGAELLSIRCENKEYIWQGDPKIWGRHAPILFPIVGKVFGGEYRVGEKTYRMGQHGFARDMQWQVVRQDETSVLLRLEATEDTLAKYPYRFVLETEFIIDENILVKRDTVRNADQREMFYQLGNHPGFLYRDFDEKDQFHAYMALFCGHNQLSNIELSTLTEEGYVEPDGYNLNMPQGLLPLSDSIFANDALVIEDSQVSQCVLLDKTFKPYLSVIFPDSEVLGIWSPKGKNAPFVCVEPWSGRADRDQFCGDLSQRDWIQRLAPEQSRTTEMRIVIRKM